MQSPSLDLRDLCVRAGAGAGKTTNLTQNVLTYAMEHKRQVGTWPKVVVTTFTRKATQELRERLLKKSVLEFPEALEFVRSSHLLTVSTMHGLMDRYLRAHGLERGLSPQYSLIGKAEGRRAKRKVLRQVLKSHEELSPLLQELGFSDLLGFLEGLRARPLTESDWSYLSVKDQEALAWKHFSEMGQALEGMAADVLAENPRQEWVEFARSVQVWVSSWRGKSWQQVYEQASESYGSLSKPRLNKKVDSPRVQELSEAFQKAPKKISVYSSASCNPQYWKHLENHYRLFEVLSAKFETGLTEELLGSSKLLLEDLETQALALLQEFPGTAREFGARWNYWMIDEYQDTSPIQVKILKEWVGQSPLYVVGDPQQSIYLFRGARREVFFEMWERTQVHGETLLLKKNYRSDPELLKFINWSTQSLGAQFDSMEPRAPAENKSAVATFMKARSDEEEWLQIKTQLLHLLTQEKARPDQICILARTKESLADLASRLQESGFPYYLHGGESFLNRRAVLDVLQVLRFLINPWDDKNLVALLRSPWVGLSDAKIQQVAASPGASLWQKLRQVGPEWAETKTLMDLLQSRKDSDLKTLVFEFCRERLLFSTSYAIDSSGLREANLFKAFHWIENHLRRPGVNLLEVFQTDVDLDGSMDSDAVSTLEPNRIQLMTFHAAKGLESDYVFMPSLHKKPNLDQWHALTLHEERSKWGFRLSFQDSESSLKHPAEMDWVNITKTRQMEEEWRVFYVGLTRAKKKLYLSWQVGPDGAPLKGGPASLYGQIRSDSNLPFVFTLCEPLDEQASLAIASKKFSPEDSGGLGSRRPWQGAQQVQLQKTSVTREISTGYRPKDVHTLRQGLEKSVRGERAHRVFELLKISDNPQALQNYVERWFGQDGDEVLEALKFLQGLQSPPLAEILANGEAEWSFLVEWDSKLLEGQLDLYGRDGQGRLWVVDYKSGSTVYKDKAFAQMKIYAQALKTVGLAKDEKISLCALYPFEKKAFVEELAL